MIRPAGLADLPSLRRMAAAFLDHADTGLPHDAAWIDAGLRGALEAPDRVVLVLDDARGMLAGGWALSPLAPVRIAHEIVFWIDPPARSLTAATALIAAFEAWCAAQGCNRVGLVDPPWRSAAALYARCGYQRAETVWHKVF